MKTLISTCRCLLFLPTAFIAGQLTAFLFFAIALPLTCWSTSLTAMAMGLGGVVQVVAGATAGLLAAPLGSRGCRSVLRACYGAAGLFHVVCVYGLLSGQISATEFGLALPALSGWWCLLAHSLGIVYGCFGVTQAKVDDPRTAAKRADTPRDQPHNPLKPVPAQFHWTNPQ